MAHQKFCTSSPNYTLRHSGVALVTVLFMFAMATIVVAGVAILTNINLNRSKAYLESEQARLFCLSGEEWARQILYSDFQLNPTVTHIHQPWAKQGLMLEVDHGYIEVSIEDAQASFNINNLVDANGNVDVASLQAFQRLLTLLSLDSQKSTIIANQLADWMDRDNAVGTEENIYINAGAEYRPPNTWTQDPSEIRLLKDMTKEFYSTIYHRGMQFMIALPQQTPVNINTVSPEVLAAMTGMELGQARSVVSNIQANPNGASDVGFALMAIPQNAQALLSKLSVTSDYFRVRVRVRYGDQYAFLVTILHLDRKKGGEISVISRDASKRFIFPFSSDYNKTLDNSDYQVDI